MLYVVLQFEQYEIQEVLNSAAIQSAICETELCCVPVTNSTALTQQLPASNFKVQIAERSIVPVTKQAFSWFFIPSHYFEETFRVL